MQTSPKKIFVYFILAEENLFHPHYFNEVIKKLDKRKYTIVGVTVAKDKYKNGLFDFIIKLLYLWGPFGFIMIGGMTVLISILNKIIVRPNLSISAAALSYNIPFYTTNNVNSDAHLQYLKIKKINIIVSSNGQIFKDKLLNLPTIACINRHTALLPNYGGVLPVFWAMYFKEKNFGVSMHYMVKEIDKGKVIIQEKIPFKTGYSLFANYVIGFQESIDITIKGIEETIKKREYNILSNKKVSYYTFPTRNQMQEFRKKNTAFAIADIYFYLKNIAK